MLILNRATSVYAIMILVFGVGLWAILQVGRFMQAPPDLAGEWESIDSPDAPKLTIEQSGQFFVLGRDGWPRVSAKLVEQAEIDGAVPPTVRLRIVTEGWTVVAQGPRGGDVFRFEMKGPNVADTFDAHRVRRRYLTGRGEGQASAATQPAAGTPTHARR